MSNEEANWLIIDGDRVIIRTFPEDNAEAAAIRWAQGAVGRTVIVAKVIREFRSSAAVIDASPKAEVEIAVGDREIAATSTERA